MCFQPIATPITLKEDANDNLQTRFIETIFSDFLRKQALSHCTGAAGLKLRPLELCSRFEAGRRRPGAASQLGEQEQSNHVKAIVPPPHWISIFHALVVLIQGNEF